MGCSSSWIHLQQCNSLDPGNYYWLKCLSQRCSGVKVLRAVPEGTALFCIELYHGIRSCMDCGMKLYRKTSVPPRVSTLMARHASSCCDGTGTLSFLPACPILNLQSGAVSHSNMQQVAVVQGMPSSLHEVKKHTHNCVHQASLTHPWVAGVARSECSMPASRRR